MGTKGFQAGIASICVTLLARKRAGLHKIFVRIIACRTNLCYNQHILLTNHMASRRMVEIC